MVKLSRNLRTGVEDMVLVEKIQNNVASCVSGFYCSPWEYSGIDIIRSRVRTGHVGAASRLRQDMGRNQVGSPCLTPE